MPDDKILESLDVVERSDVLRSCYCVLPRREPRKFASNVTPDRARAIVNSDKKLVNGQTLRYYFYDQPEDGEQVMYDDGSTEFRSWVGEEEDKAVIRQAFREWMSVGMGLGFEEVDNRYDAEIRIGFMRGDGHWSYIGRDIFEYGPDLRTMNFDGPLSGSDGFDTALHEIGHTLGLEHEHQNPNAGIVWNEDRVYRDMAKPPNEWSEQETFDNIIAKVSSDGIRSSAWDRNSVMHYPFEAGMIRYPEEFQTMPLLPEYGLSPVDMAWARKVYPAREKEDLPRLEPFISQAVHLEPGGQFDAVIEPSATRSYTVQTFGESDMLLTLFEDTGERCQFLTGDDDSGEDRNARIRVRLLRGHRYVVRARLFYSRFGGDAAIMMV